MNVRRIAQRLVSLFTPVRSTPLLSIVVIVFNMRREAPRTLFSLSAGYQQGVNPDDYEVIVVENGSSQPLSAEEITQFGQNFRYLWIDKASPSPAGAINQGIALSQAPFVGIMIDGARIVTPGVIALALQCLNGFERAVVGTVGFHLGPDTQMYSLRHGYNRIVEDKLLSSIDWQNNGYRLFEIGSQAGSSPLNWLGTINESNLIFLSRALFSELKGYDERFTLPGGGIVNLDFYRRACDLERSTLITLLGEATFHQVHGGTITNQPAPDLPRLLQSYGEEYIHIRGRPFERSARPVLLCGQVRPAIMPWLQKACDFAGSIPGTPLNTGKAQTLANQGITIPDDPPSLLFSVLAELGLHESHYLLELVSGAPTAASLYIAYLQPGHYCALEFTDRQLAQETTALLGAELIASKQARFAHSDEFVSDLFGTHTGFDFILAATLLSHMGLTRIRQSLISARQALRPSGLLIAAFDERADDAIHGEWVYPSTNSLRWTTLVDACIEVGLHCRKLNWRFSRKTWFVAAIDLRRLEIARLSHPCPDDSSATPIGVTMQ